MDLGFSPDMGAVAAGAATLTKLVLYPLAQLRRRLDADHDGAVDDGPPKGATYLPPDLATPMVMLAVVGLGALFAGLAHQPLFPVLSAAMTGMLSARVGHEAIASARSGG